MGEYAKIKGTDRQIKIGTCEDMYYLRYEDRYKVEKLPHSLDASKEFNLRWRLPFPDEDNLLPGEYENHSRGLPLIKPHEKFNEHYFNLRLADDPGTIQLTHQSGLLANIKCFHGEKLPDSSEHARFHWNGKSWFYELAQIKNTRKGIIPIIHCRHCGQKWRAEWADIWDFISTDMRVRLKKYAQDMVEQSAGEAA